MRLLPFSRTTIPIQQLPNLCLASYRNPTFVASHRRHFSSHKTNPTTKDHRPQELPNAKTKPAESQMPNPSYPAFSLKDLDMKRGTKFFVIACLSVLGTMETVFWVKVIWAKLSPPLEEESE